MCSAEHTADSDTSHSVIKPYTENPHFLAWDGVPIFPLGPTGYHAWTPITRPATVDFIAQMNRMNQIIEEIGSPHIRGFMRFLPYDPLNHLHDGSVERFLQPWVQLEDERYDLSKFEPEWEERMIEYLDAALSREIVVSMEVWDDWSVTRGVGGSWDPGEGAAWNGHPFNPNNNINFDETKLPSVTTECDAPFYRTIPSHSNIESVLELQKLYVDKILQISSDYPNVLINISNESRATMEWSRYWAEYVRERVPEGVMIGDMPSTNRQDGGGECEHAFSPATLVTDSLYDFVDVAQGVSRHEFGSPREQALGGGLRMYEYRRAMTESVGPRPLIVSKDYTRGDEGGDIVLWSRFMGGAAAARFHRPGMEHGDALIDFQHDAVHRLGYFLAEIPFWNMYPAHDILQKYDDTIGANVMAEPEGHVVVQLLDVRRRQRLALDVNTREWTVRWIDPSSGHELERQSLISETPMLELDIPVDKEHLILHLQP